MGGTGAAGPQQAGRPRPPKAPGWESVRGDERGTRADQVRQAVATVRLEVFVQEQQVPLSLEMDARDDQPTTIHLLVRGQGGEPLGAARLLLEPEHPARSTWAAWPCGGTPVVPVWEPAWSRPWSRRRWPAPRPGWDHRPQPGAGYQQVPTESWCCSPPRSRRWASMSAAATRQ